MGLFSSEKEGSKKKEGNKLPALPREESPTSSSNSNEEGLPPLPSFPSSKTGEKVSNQAAKQAIQSPKQQAGQVSKSAVRQAGEEKLRPSTSGKKVQQPQSKAQPQQMGKPSQKRTKEISGREQYISSVQRPAPRESQLKPQKEKSVYVKLDDFEEGEKKLKKVRKEIKDIEEKLEDVKDLKEKEEKEIEKWEKEIDKAKSQIKKIQSSIFQEE